jgi:hypothetical protein
MHVSRADSTKDIPDFAPDMFKDWVKQYIVDTRGDAFCIPNPRKFGKGASSSRWHAGVVLNRLTIQATRCGLIGIG